jgi:hypothetical protein
MNRTVVILSTQFPTEWRLRRHPFLQKYGRGKFLDFTDLFQHHLHFKDSKQQIGIQLADICAHIAYRSLNGQAVLGAFQSLVPRIIAKTSEPVLLIHLDPDYSLLKDAIENHVKIRHGNKEADENDPK